MSKTNNKDIRCSFCGISKSDAQMLIAGDGAHICDRCVTQAGEILTEELKQRKNKTLQTTLELIRPTEIKEHLKVITLLLHVMYRERACNRHY